VESGQFRVRDLRRGGWFWVENRILEEHGVELGAAGVAVYCVLARHAGREDQVAWPSRERICAMLGMGHSQVSRALRILEEVGLVRIERRRGAVNVYQLLGDPGNPSHSGRGSGPNPSHSGRPPVPQQDTNNPYDQYKERQREERQRAAREQGRGQAMVLLQQCGFSFREAVAVIQRMGVERACTVARLALEGQSERSALGRVREAAMAAEVAGAAG